MEQSKLVEVKSCPVCGSDQKKEFLKTLDHGHSKEEFSIQECLSCSFRYTSPIPSELEIGKYYNSENYISHTDSKKGIMNRVYQTVRKRAIKHKFDLVQSSTKDNTLLDIGCGTGDFLKYVKDYKWKVKGLEPDEGAREICASKGLEIEHTNQLHLLKDESFSVITMWHVLEHVYNLNKDFEKISQVLKPDGTLFVAVPNCASYDAEKYGGFWGAYDLPIHLYHFRPNDIKKLAENYNMEVKEILPMVFDSYYVSMLSEKYKGGNLAKAFFTGLKSNRIGKKTGEAYSSQIYVLKKKK